jgi:hypothetical protein
MLTPQPQDLPVHSLTLRKVELVICGILIIVPLMITALHHRAYINIEQFGLPENYLYYGSFGLIIIGGVLLRIFWRCPECGAPLGKEFSPAQCPACSAKFN